MVLKINNDYLEVYYDGLEDISERHVWVFFCLSTILFLSLCGVRVGYWVDSGRLWDTTSQRACKLSETMWPVELLSPSVQLHTPHCGAGWESLFGFFSMPARWSSLVLSLCLLYHALKRVCEVVSGKEILKVQVHTVAPVVLRIGRNIYSLCLGVGETQFLVGGEPVLQC